MYSNTKSTQIHKLYIYSLSVFQNNINSLWIVCFSIWGEKNATLESIEKIASALNVPLSELFEKLGETSGSGNNIPLACYEFLSAKTREEQEQLYRILIEMDKYKGK